MILTPFLRHFSRYPLWKISCSLRLGSSISLALFVYGGNGLLKRAIGFFGDKQSIGKALSDMAHALWNTGMKF